ncbi:MAG: ABC transporter permease, partial [Terriglobia bacterium]
YIVIRALGADLGVWPRLWAIRLPPLLISTIGLASGVTLITIVIGVPAAWLTVMTDLPGKKTWQWLLALPLAVPPYIGSLAYITIFAPLGLAQRALASLLGVSPFDLQLPSVFSFPSVALIMAAFTYPYVFLITSSALRKQNQSLIDAARGSGLSSLRIFFKVTVPLLRPSIGAGSLLVALYVLADFGAISLLRYPTFTSAIYQQLTGGFNREAAAALSLVLMLITLVVLFLEGRSRAKARYYQTVSSFRPATTIGLGRWRGAALLLPATLVFMSLVVPIGTLVYWSVLALGKGGLSSDFWTYTLNSVVTSGSAASLAVVLALPVVFLSVRHPSVVSRTIFRISYSGYAIPGVLIGLGLIFFFNSAVPLVYGTVPVIIVGYIVHYFPQCLQAQESALAAVSPNLEEAARSFGLNVLRVWQRVTVPLLLPALAAGWTLVFISSMKELAATLLLRPPGFDTLAVRVWMEASEGFYDLAAPPALLLVVTSAIPLIIITRRTRRAETERDRDQAASRT